MKRSEFIMGALSLGALSGCESLSGSSRGGRILFGACCAPSNVKQLKSVGYDFWEWNAASAYVPKKGDEDWKRQRDIILSQPLPLRSSNGFIPGEFRLTGPKADPEPALRYAETVLRRADEVGVKTIVFGSSGARNVPGDITGGKEQRPNLEAGRDQYAEFCKTLCARVADLKTVQVVIEPLRPRESNIINYVWQGVQICKEVNSPRLGQLADLFHMMMGREEADSILKAGSYLRHCHVASYETRKFPGSDPATVSRLQPYFDALRQIGYSGGVSCECGWGDSKDYARNLETALATLKKLSKQS